MCVSCHNGDINTTHKAGHLNVATHIIYPATLLPAPFLTEYQLWISRLQVLHTNNTIAWTRIIGTNSGKTEVLLSLAHQHNEEHCAETNNPKMPGKTKEFLCYKPHACAQTAVDAMMLVR